MDVACKSCGTTLKIPDEKLPPNQVVNATCPKCKGKLEYDSEKNILSCQACRLKYKVENDIPNMLIDEAESF